MQLFELFEQDKQRLNLDVSTIEKLNPGEVAGFKGQGVIVLADREDAVQVFFDFDPATQLVHLVQVTSMNDRQKFPIYQLDFDSESIVQYFETK